jgi:hypothetical protein
MGPPVRISRSSALPVGDRNVLTGVPVRSAGATADAVDDREAGAVVRHTAEIGLVTTRLKRARRFGNGMEAKLRWSASAYTRAAEVGDDEVPSSPAPAALTPRETQ